MKNYESYPIEDLVKDNPYPGRGIIVGNTENHTIAAYFIMGRSVNSRNRIFVKEEDGIRTEAYDARLLSDPSLIIYHPVREFEDKLIVTNGDQTDTVRDGLKEGRDFAQSLRTREFEPDGPNWTPRISALIEKDGSYRMSILKSVDERGSACVRETFEFPAVNGLGHFIHTYDTDGNPIPTFSGEPERVVMSDDMEEFTETLWNNLNSDNKISLYVRYIDRKDDGVREIILNKHTEEL